ncbi:MAG: carbon starvation CstA family protein, partial [Clostridia bacterium]|nr:carbon starvation CstA family protein [Clostridia bacterium]
ETKMEYTAAAKANGSTATTSLLFIAIAMVFGFFVYRKNAPMSISTIVGVIGIIVCIVIGLKFPLMGVNADIWMLVVFAYIFVASIAPVWILLQPRDYLNSFLLYGMIVAAVIGVFFTNPTINLPAFTGFGGINGNSQLFPVLFITVACGAISGFHSLVGSGTSSKQLDKESDAKIIGYGGMLIECALAIIALIAVGMLFKDGTMPAGTPVNVFATGVATMLSALLGDASYTVAYNIITLAFSAFCLTSLDTATRLARYMFQEFFVGEEGSEAVNAAGWRKFLANPYVATLITVVVGALLARGGYAAIWPLFGAANQLLAALALLALAAWLGNTGKSNGMLIFPMLFMLVATLTSLVITIKTQFGIITTAATSAAWLQLIFAVLLVVLAVLLAIEGCQTIFGKKKKA